MGVLFHARNPSANHSGNFPVLPSIDRDTPSDTHDPSLEQGLAFERFLTKRVLIGVLVSDCLQNVWQPLLQIQHTEFERHMYIPAFGRIHGLLELWLAAESFSDLTHDEELIYIEFEASALSRSYVAAIAWSRWKRHTWRLVGYSLHDPEFFTSLDHSYDSGLNRWGFQWVSTLSVVGFSDPAHCMILRHLKKLYLESLLFLTLVLILHTYQIPRVSRLILAYPDRTTRVNQPLSLW